MSTKKTRDEASKRRVATTAEDGPLGLSLGELMGHPPQRPDPVDTADSRAAADVKQTIEREAEQIDIREQTGTEEKSAQGKPEDVNKTAKTTDNE